MSGWKDKSIFRGFVSRAFLFRPLLIFLFFILVFYRYWGGTVFCRDSFLFFAPNKFFLAEALKGWTIYFWNPYQWLGIPFAAEVQAGVFYPLNIIFALFDFGTAHKLFILIHYPLAAIGMDLYLRGRGLDRKAALFGGLVFALSGYMISQHALVRMVLGAAWAPLALYCFERAIAGRLVWAMYTGVVLILQVLASDPLTAALTSLVGTIITLGASWNQGNLRRGILIVSIAGFSALALGAIQILPTYEMMNFSNRAQGLSLENSLFFSFHPARLFEIVWPTPYGLKYPFDYFWGKFTLDTNLDTTVDTWSMSNYLGLPALTLAAVGIVASRRRWKFWLLAGMTISLLLTLGRHTPFYSWGYEIFPLFRYFRYPAKYMVWFTGFTAVAAALGLEKIEAWIKADNSRIARGGLYYLGLAGGSALAGYKLWPLVLDWKGPHPQGSMTYRFELEHIYSSCLQFAAINLIGGVVLFLIGKKTIAPNRGLWMLLGIIVIDLWLTNVNIMPAGPKDIYSYQSLASKIIRKAEGSSHEKFRIFREELEYRELHTSNPTWELYSLVQIKDKNNLRKNLGMMEGFEEFLGYGSYEIREGYELFTHGLPPFLLELYNVKYIISPFNRDPIKDVKTETIYHDYSDDLTITRFPDAWPRSYWISSARRAKDQDQARKMLYKTDLRYWAVITTDEDVEDTHLPTRAMEPAKIISYEPDRVVIETEVDQPGWLVLSDRDYPGWHANIDGKPAKIYKANVIVRAVRVPKGRHRVEFTFVPTFLHLGMAISIPAWILACLWASLEGIRGRQSRKRPKD